MKWNDCGTMVGENGNMNISIEEVEKLSVLYTLKKNSFGFMVILGKGERDKFEMQRELFSKEVQTLYDEATVYHDGKWIMFELRNTELFSDIERLLETKRLPNRKLLS